MSKTRSHQSARRAKPKRTNRRHRPRFETLESRRLLAVYTVDTFLDTVDANVNDGIAADVSGRTSLRAAVMQANASSGADTILLPAGTYQLNIRGSAEDAAATGDLDIVDDLTIIGDDAVTTIVDAGGDTGLLDRIFDVPNSTRQLPRSVTIQGITLQGGRVYSSGSSDFNSGGAIDVGFFNNVVVAESQFFDNRVNSLGRGGAIHNNGVLTVSGSVFEGNSATSAGGALFSGGNTGVSASSQFDVMAAIRDSSLSNNVAGNGGAISSHSPLFIESTTVDNNLATRNGQGGGIELQSSIFSSLQMINSTVSGNYGRYGGGISSSLGSNSFHSMEVNNSTITNNHADIQGGGLSLSSVGGPGVSNSIIANNTVGNPTFVGVGPDIRGTLTSAGNNLIGDDSGILGGLLISDLINVSPQLGPLADNEGATQTHALLPGSPAIDAANALTAAALDQQGISRPQGAAADIGSFELTGTNSAPIAVNDDYSVSEDGALIVDGPQQPVLHYSFDSDTSAGEVVDLGKAPKATGQLVGFATTTDSTPNGFSNAALDLTSENGVSFVSDGDADKIDQMTEMTATFWLNLQADPNEGDVLLSDLTSFPADPFTSGWELRITGPGTGIAPTADDFRLEFETAHIGSSLANAQTSFKGPVNADQ